MISEWRKLLRVNVLTPLHVGIVTAFCIFYLNGVFVVPDTQRVTPEVKHFGLMDSQRGRYEERRQCDKVRGKVRPGKIEKETRS